MTEREEEFEEYDAESESAFREMQALMDDQEKELATGTKRSLSKDDNEEDGEPVLHRRKKKKHKKRRRFAPASDSDPEELEEVPTAPPPKTPAFAAVDQVTDDAMAATTMAAERKVVEQARSSGEGEEDDEEDEFEDDDDEQPEIVHAAKKFDLMVQINNPSAFTEAIAAVKEISAQATLNIIPGEGHPEAPSRQSSFPGPSARQPHDSTGFEGVVAEILAKQTHLVHFQIAGFVSMRPGAELGAEDFFFCIHMKPFLEFLRGLQAGQVVQFLRLHGQTETVDVAVMDRGQEKPARLLSISCLEKQVRVLEPMKVIENLDHMVVISKMDFVRALKVVMGADGKDMRMRLLEDEATGRWLFVIQCLGSIYEQIVYERQRPTPRKDDGRLVMYAFRESLVEKIMSEGMTSSPSAAVASVPGKQHEKTKKPKKRKKKKKPKTTTTKAGKKFKQSKISFSVKPSNDLSYGKLSELKERFCIVVSVDDLIKFCKPITAKSLTLFFMEDGPMMLSSSLGTAGPDSMLNLATHGCGDKDALANRYDDLINFDV